MRKETYQTPLTELFELRFEAALLQGSVEGMNEVEGSWEEDS